MKILERILILVLAVMIFVVPISLMFPSNYPTIAEAAEITKTFAWDEPSDLALIKNWEMHYGTTAGGPYAKLADIAKDGDYESPVTVDITGPPASNQTRYFVMKACGDVPKGGDIVEYECSEFSNEASFTVWIPANKFQVPINFRILPD